MRVGAHRGLCKNPSEENKLVSLKRAYQEGMDYAEIDLQYTKDGAIAIIHDDTIVKEGKQYRVCDLTYSELIEIDIDIPLLDEVLDYFSKTDFYLLLEIKPCVEVIGDRAYEYLESLYSMLKAYDLKKIMVFSIDYEALSIFNNIDKSSIVEKGIIGTYTMDDPISFMEKYNATLYLSFLKNLNSEIVAKIKSKNYLVSASVINNKEDMKKAQNIGADMFETDKFYDLCKDRKQ